MTQTALSPRAQYFDQLRTTARIGIGMENPAYATQGVLEALGDRPDDEVLPLLLLMFWMFDEWDPRVDRGDHDMGMIRFRGVEVYFKIDQISEENVKVTFFLLHEF